MVFFSGMWNYTAMKQRSKNFFFRSFFLKMGEIKWLVIDYFQKITTKERKLLNNQLSNRIAIESR